jgi:NRPS condensation-like uncharacterized protein
VLRLERVGVHDNFFELGGESILSIQIISRANQAGLRLKPRDVFERPTIAELAAGAGEAGARRAEQAPVVGALPLTPIQRRYFEQQPAEPAHYNHALLLAARRRLDPDRLRAALAALERQHDALRLRFVRTGAGWSQSSAPPQEQAPLAFHDLSQRAREACDDVLRSHADAAQAGLDLAQGPIWRALHFRLPDGEDDRLLLIVHHLAVDGVSWRLLLEDLVTAYGRLEQGRAVELPARTDSFRLWAESLVARASSPVTTASAAWWLDAARRQAPRLPVDHEPAAGANIAQDARTLEVALDEAETAALLHQVPRAYRTQINDVLLAALVAACAPWTGSRRLRAETSIEVTRSFAQDTERLLSDP